MWPAPCKKTLYVHSRSEFVHFLAFGHLRNMWSAGRQEKQTKLCPFRRVFFLKTLHPHNGCLPAHCRHGGSSNMFGSALEAKTRLVVFLMTVPRFLFYQETFSYAHALRPFLSTTR